MRLLVSGGCKNGKSTLAQRLSALQGTRRVYIATMLPRDAEDRERIAAHQRERAGWGFETVECSSGVEQLANRFAMDTSLLLDSTTALLAEEMFIGGEADILAGERVLRGLQCLLDAYENVVLVSDTIYSDACHFGELTEIYRKSLAEIDRALAGQCDGVLEQVFGQTVVHKGDERVAELAKKALSDAWNGIGAIYGHSGVCQVG